jgi:hypothetical protein
MLDDKVFEQAWEHAGRLQIPRIESGFLGDNTPIYRNFMEADLRKSGLKSMHMGADVPQMIPQGCDAAYVIPYCDLDGKILPAMHRTRLRRPEHSKESRYTQPSGETLSRNGLPSFIPYIHPLTLQLESEVMICAEGEKKTASIIRFLGLPAFGIGGCQMWRNPDGSGGIHPWIKRLLQQRGCSKVLIVPDGDLFRYDICNAYGTFAHTLRETGVQVEIINPPGKIDDLLVNWESPGSSFVDLPRVSLDDLVQSHTLLASRYNLAFRKNEKGVVSLHQTSSNVMKLMEEHKAFPKIWRNLDTNRVFIGDDQATPDLTEMQIANYFQHNLGFEKVTHRMIFSCVQALAKQNQKSPFLDYVKGLHWDGQPRLNTWLTDYWGVSDSEYIQEVASKWLISACARMENPGTKVDWMMIVVGPQGTGKTSMPAVIFNGNSLTLYGESNDKDLHMKIHSALVIGFDELDSFGKKESSFLKAMITTSQDHFRPPYGSAVEVFDRRCTLYGCGNRHEFLQSDPSGYRRYAIVEVSQLLDFQQLEAARDQIWAEAWYRYSNSKEAYWEVKLASKEAEKYVAPNEFEYKIQNFLDALRNSPLYHKNGLMYTQYGAVAESLGFRPNPREVAAVLRKLGGEQKRNDRGPQSGSPRDWWVFPISYEKDL